MQRRKLFIILAACGAALVGILSAQQAGTQGSSTIYYPYPPGITPPGISEELVRVSMEVQGIENEAIAEWKGLTPPTLAGNPPILMNTGYQAVEILGKLMNYDQNISVFQDQACASCHMPYAAFGGPIPSVNLTMIAYPGSVHLRAGKRTPQRYTYASFFPALQYNQEQGLFYGGNFWDSRATGYLIRNPAANQAQFPPVDPAEMGQPDTACIVYRLSQAVYRPLFELVWGAGSFDINWPANAEQICSTPNGDQVFGGNTMPLQLSAADRTRSNTDYDHWGQSLDAYEESPRVSAFSSKFDAFLKNKYTFTPAILTGEELLLLRSTPRITAPPRVLTLCSLALVRPMKGCPGIPRMPSTMKPSRMLSVSHLTQAALATRISAWELSSGAASVLRQIRTRAGYSMPLL